MAVRPVWTPAELRVMTYRSNHKYVNLSKSQTDKSKKHIGYLPFLLKDT